MTCLNNLKPFSKNWHWFKVEMMYALYINIVSQLRIMLRVYHLITKTLGLSLFFLFSENSRPTTFKETRWVDSTLTSEVTQVTIG